MPVVEGVVVDEYDGSGAVVIQENLENARDYELLELWEVTSYDSDSGSSPTTTVKFVDGQPFHLPIHLFENDLVESNQTIVLKTNANSPFGFTQQAYTFGESDDIVLVGVSPTSTIHQVTITINDNDHIDQTSNGDAADNSLSGTNGNAQLSGGAGNDTLNGGDGNDKLYGGDSNRYEDNSSTGGGNDSLNGGAGNDTLHGGLGSDAMFGGLGNDTYYVDDPGDTVTEFQNQGRDTVNSSIDYTLGNYLDNLRLTDSAISGIGNASNNKIIGNSGNNSLFGRDGNDTVFGQGGDDTLDAENGEDRLYGGTGNDSLLGGSGTDYLNGGNDNDSLSGGSGSDTLDGWEGNDSLNGGNNSDTLLGDLGNDTLYGENGNDYLYGEENDDNLDGGEGQDTLDGGAGNDTLLGGLGNDSLVGGDGNDRLNGYGMTMTSDAQIDTLTGGVGTDYFVLGGTWGVSYVETGDGYAIIADWDASSDFIEVLGSSSQYSLDVSRNVIGGSAVDTEIYYIGGGGSERIGIVQDTTDVSISRDFIFV